MIRPDIEIFRSWRLLAAVAGMKKPNDHAEQTKVERYKKSNEHVYSIEE